MSRMIVVLGILGFIAIPATAHAAAPDAWSVGGPGSTFVAGCQGLGSLENDLVEQIPDFVAGLQLEDPDLKGLRADLLKTLGLKGKRSFAQAFALRPDGAVVLHVMHKPGAAQAPDWVVAFDVTNGQTFSGNMIKVFKAVTARAQKADLESRREELKASRETAERHRNQAIQHRPMRDGVAADAPFECPDDMHDDGLLNCAPRGICDSLFHDGGAGTCVPRGSCSRGYRLWERDGTCNKKKEPKPGPAVKVGRQQKLPGGGREVEICPTEIEGCFRIRVVGNLAFLAESAAVLDALQPEATELQPTAGLFHAGGGTGMGCLLRLRRREPNEPPVPWTPFVESVELISRVAEDGSHTALDLHLGPAADGQLTFLRPSETGADVRLRMKTLVHGDLSGWWRVGLDLQAAWTQMQSMIPPEGLTNIKKEWTDRTGLDLEKDVIGVLTGDLLGTCEGGALGCVLSVGIRGKKGALAAMKRLQNTLEKTLPKGEVSMERLSRSDGVDHYRTNLAFTDDDERNWRLSWHWSVDDEMIHLALFPAPIKALVARKSSGSGYVEPPLFNGQGFGLTDLVSGQVQVGGLGALVRQGLAAVRAWVPQGWWLGRLTRLADVAVAMGDQVVDQSTLVTRDGAHLRVESHARFLPTEGQPGFLPDLSARWKTAMALRYAGRVRASNRQLAQLALDAADTPWGRRAEACALGTGDLLSSFLPIFAQAMSEELKGLSNVVRLIEGLSNLRGGGK